MQDPSELSAIADSPTLRERWGDHRQLRRFLSNPAVILAIAWLVLVIVCAIFAPWIAPHDPNAQNLEHASAGISASHLARDRRSRARCA